MLPEKPYLRQIGLLEVGKFAKKPYFSQFYRRSKRAAPIKKGNARNIERKSFIIRLLLVGTSVNVESVEKLHFTLLLKCNYLLSLQPRANRSLPHSHSGRAAAA